MDNQEIHRGGVRKLTSRFYARPADRVAEELIGKILVRRINDSDGRPLEFRARIIETEAYVGEHDLACHAAKGRTGRTEIMFGPAGFAYVYFIYGMYDMLNIVASDVGDAQAVLIRGAVAIDGSRLDLSGPGKLARGMRITRRDNGVDLTGDELFVMSGSIVKPKIVRTPRIGVDYARHWKDAPLRFVDADFHKPLSRKRISGLSSGTPEDR
ncbi:MAG TPA: DNA-3-methyladenine glycosylase [Tepidisphaeraceae bacterium]|nr:DNA-3-methyladenine glycosylase [Tepidisphaeraceae bacterium]